MLGANQMAKNQLTPYATTTDFCRIFRDDMTHLYLLSLLLTGDQATAEKCFVHGLKDSHRGNPVFREWAHSWARRMIVANAIRLARPHRDKGRDGITPAGNVLLSTVVPAEIAAVMGLPSFERFALVMSVLEGYSDRECSLLLGCAGSDIDAARNRALTQIGKAAILRCDLVSVDSLRQLLPDDSGPSSKPEIVSHLALSA